MRKSVKKCLLAGVVLVFYSFGTAMSGYAAGRTGRAGYIEEIPEKYHGYYYCDTDPYWFFITGATSSVFLGKSPSEGLVSATDLDPSTIKFNPDTQLYGENFVFQYLTWAKKVGDQSLKQDTTLTLGGNCYNYQQVQAGKQTEKVTIAGKKYYPE